MQMGLIFWIIMLIWFLVLVGGITGFGFAYSGLVSSVMLFLLLLLLGWKVFGRPVQ